MLTQQGGSRKQIGHLGLAATPPTEATAYWRCYVIKAALAEPSLLEDNFPGRVGQGGNEVAV